MGEAISGEDAFDGANGGQRLNAISVQSPTNGLGSAREAPIIKMESFHDNDLLDLSRVIVAHGVPFKVA